MDCIMQFKRGMQQQGVSTMNTLPIFSKLFHLQLAAIHTWARRQEKHCCGFMLLQPAFLLPVNLKISQSWLVSEWGAVMGQSFLFSYISEIVLQPTATALDMCPLQFPSECILIAVKCWIAMASHISLY